jgi:hypothetical protein
MKIGVMPCTRLGRWSIGLIGGLVLSFAVLAIMAATGQTGGETFSDNLLLAIPGFLAAGCGIAAFFTGVIGVIMSKERSVFVFVSTAFGLLVLLFVLGEVLSPH